MVSMVEMSYDVVVVFVSVKRMTSISGDIKIFMSVESTYQKSQNLFRNTHLGRNLQSKTQNEIYPQLFV